MKVNCRAAATVVCALRARASACGRPTNGHARGGGSTTTSIALAQALIRRKRERRRRAAWSATAPWPRPPGLGGVGWGGRLGAGAVTAEIKLVSLVRSNHGRLAWRAGSRKLEEGSRRARHHPQHYRPQLYATAKVTYGAWAGQNKIPAEPSKASNASGWVVVVERRYSAGT
jgi:hypothetical protein